MRADGSGQQNVLLGHRLAVPDAARERRKPSRGSSELSATATWTQHELAALLAAIGLDPDAPISVLAVEIIPGSQPAADPLGTQLGSERILRASPLVAAPHVCVDAVS
jgi:hypothetical protein